MKKTITLKTARDLRAPSVNVDKKIDNWVNGAESNVKIARLHMNLTKDMHRTLKSLCANVDMTITAYVVMLIERDMKERNRGQ